MRRVLPAMVKYILLNEAKARAVVYLNKLKIKDCTILPKAHLQMIEDTPWRYKINIESKKKQYGLFVDAVTGIVSQQKLKN